MHNIRWCASLALMLGVVSTASHAAPPLLTRLLDGARALAPALGDASLRQSESDRQAAVDYGPGPGLPRSGGGTGSRTSLVAAPAAAIPAGGATAGAIGAFGPAISWPLIPIHLVLLPSGRVMSYGSTAAGAQGAQLIYDVWDPAQGGGANAHLTLPNSTGTDIFCSAQSMLWGSGTTLITGGDQTVSGKRNYSNNKTTVFTPASNSIASGPAMAYPRWYNSIVPLPSGRMLVLGGRADPNTSVLAPELYDPATGWSTLAGATSQSAFQNYYYPRAFVAPGGGVFILGNNGRMYLLDPTGAGSISQYPGLAPTSVNQLPVLMVAPGKLLAVRSSQTVVVDINGSRPVVTPTGNLSQLRLWASGTVMADGRVVVTGGSLVANEMTGVAYSAEIWNPSTGAWTLGPAATKPRLYHSNALLLPDGSVLTGGGGAPGPVKNLNAEIYYPSYLYAPSGQPAPRPSLSGVPVDVKVGASFAVTVGASDRIGRVTFVRAGSSTHSMNLEQRFLDLPFGQSGASVTASLPSNPNVVLPGYWLLFVWQNGVPSVAQIVRVPS